MTTPPHKELQIAEKIVRNLPETTPEPFFGNIPPHLFLLVGIFFTLIGWFLPQAIPFFIFILLYLIIRASLLIWIVLIGAILVYFIPVIEIDHWYCTECSALQVTGTTYQINTFRRLQETAYSRWYLSLVEHSEHQWKIYEKTFRNAYYQEFEEKIVNELPFPALEILSPLPQILEVLKKLPPQEAIQIFIHWEELYQSNEFKKAFLLWQGQTASFLQWIQQNNPPDYQKIQFIFNSSLKPLPQLIFK